MLKCAIIGFTLYSSQTNDDDCMDETRWRNRNLKTTFIFYSDLILSQLTKDDEKLVIDTEKKYLIAT